MSAWGDRGRRKSAHGASAKYDKGAVPLSYSTVLSGNANVRERVRHRSHLFAMRTERLLAETVGFKARPNKALAALAVLVSFHYILILLSW